MSTFNLLKIQPVIDHLHQISPKMFKRLSNEIQIHCPFCDDALRSKASNHGHCYLSINSPIFNCFRCTASGTLITLLLQTNFNDLETISYIGQFIKINFTKDYYKFKSHKDLPAINIIKKKIFETNLSFKKYNKDQFNIYNNYLKQRIGDVDYLDFLIIPGIYQNFIISKFFNYIGENILLRYVNNPNKRYINNNNTSGLYYFQNLDLNNKYNNVTICEGPFDIINLYLYNNIFKDNLFIALRGKNYINLIEKLLLEYMLLDSYTINIIFDNDYLKSSKRVLKSIKTLINIYNDKIQLNGFKPLLTNVSDVAEFPAVERIE
jgi:hypothetical protein